MIAVSLDVYVTVKVKKVTDCRATPNIPKVTENTQNSELLGLA